MMATTIVQPCISTPELWFSTDDKTIQEAKALCRVCPLLDPCTVRERVVCVLLPEGLAGPPAATRHTLPPLSAACDPIGGPYGVADGGCRYDQGGCCARTWGVVAGVAEGCRTVATWDRGTERMNGIDQLFDVVPRDWWQFVPCGYCNARRQEPCQRFDGPARAPHARRVRVARVLHGTLWLLRNGFVEDVLGPPNGLLDNYDPVPGLVARGVMSDEHDPDSCEYDCCVTPPEVSD